MRIRPRALSISICLLALGVAFCSSSYALERSRIGDGKTYYCMGNEEDGGAVYRVKNGKKVRLSVAKSEVKKKILKTRTSIKKGEKRHKNVDLLKLMLAEYKVSLSDIIACAEEGSTGKGEPSSSIDSCSVAGASTSPGASIINGQVCTIGNSPVVYVLIQGSTEDETFECTGTVVSRPDETRSSTVITAAHCAEGAIAMTINVPGGTMTASDFYSFPGWSSGQDMLEKGDIAVVRFSEEIPVPGVHVASSGLAAPGSRGVIAGYGLDEQQEASSDILRAGRVTLAQVTAASLIVEYTGDGSNTCSGDSGGPLFLDSGSGWVLVGVTSNGTEENCGAGDTSAFVNLRDPDVMDFVNQIVPGLIP